MNRVLSICAALVLSVSAQSQGYFIWTADEGDFYQSSNWDLNRIPGLNDIVIITTTAQRSSEKMRENVN